MREESLGTAQEAGVDIDLQNGYMETASLYKLDIEDNSVEEVALDGQAQDLNAYLDELLADIRSETHQRRFNIGSPTSEFHALVRSIQDSRSLSPSDKGLAERLLRIELATERKVQRLSRGSGTHLKKGSFLQWFYEENGVFVYLGVKVDHKEFLDEDDFTKRIGLALKDRLYKAVRVAFSADGSVAEVVVVDAGSRLATYWWHDFLELTEVKDNHFNTHTAAHEIEKVLNKRLRRKFPQDFTALINSVIGRFRTTGTMRYNDYIDDQFGNYSPLNEALSEDMPALIATLKDLPRRKGFDTHFDIEPSAITMRRRKFKLNEFVDLMVESGVDGLSDKVWSERTQDGKRLVVVDSPEGFNQFEEKERQP
jgi:hypothetical protein